MIRHTALPKRSLILAALAIAAASVALGHDEDWRKLTAMSRHPAFRGPIVTATDIGGGNGGIAEDFQSKDVNLLSWVPLNQFQGGNGSSADCWSYVSPSGREYAILSMQKGYGFVEVTNPVLPKIVGFIGGPSSLWHDVAVIGEYAYGCSEAGSGVQVMDLTKIDQGTVTLVKNWTSNGYSTTHTLLANPASKFLYACGSNIANGGCVPIDVSDPINPKFVKNAQGQVIAWTTRYVHEAQIVTYTTGQYAGKEVAFLCTGGPTFGSGSGGLDIVDVTDKSNLVTLAHYQYPKVGYCHQGALSEDKNYFYINDEGDEYDGKVAVTTGHIINVSNLAAPVQSGTFTNNKKSVDHNEYIRGKYLFCANYTSGLRVFDTSNPTAPAEVAWFDSHPEGDYIDFAGLWGNCPEFPSGIVIGSDMQRGLFVWQVNVGKLVYSFPNGLPQTLDENTSTEVLVKITEDGATLVDSKVQLLVSINGGGYTPVNMSSVGDGQFSASLPAAACDDVVSFYFSATAGDLRVFSSPPDAPSNVYSATVECTTCYADCDLSGELDIDDFICYQTQFGSGDMAADCDESGELDIDDFICFQTAFGAGCN